ncbi:GntR family transcriptional regulator [Secundilactobacillus silagei]|uniref:GntR family transcriptional regulator n=1 Tax=Secundilactobacillus silagei TaxID=1293415 RepID=UPI0025B14443|nr:GntR family transcriptional regulator [Secundilactobacillus silagei]
MNWQLPSGNQSLYVKVITLITNAINTGNLLPGQQLPAERKLARCSPLTGQPFNER